MTKRWLAMAVLLAACGAVEEEQSIPEIDTDPTTEEEPDVVFPDRTNSCAESSCRSFCAAETWGDESPTATSDLVIESGETVIMDCEASVGSLTIQPGGALVASRNTDSRLDVHGNLIVRGILNYGTDQARISSDVRAEVVFHPPPDDEYEGTPTNATSGTMSEPSVSTPMEVVPSDHGLWVVGEGRFYAAGGVKTSWSRLRDAVGPDDTTFEVDDVNGWLPGDRLAFTPSAVSGEEARFEEALIRELFDHAVTIEEGVSTNHPGCPDCFRRAEVLNLTRNVVFRSYDDAAHAHIMVADAAVARLDSVELRWLGPGACDEPERRAAIYFHQQDDVSRDSYLRHVAIWGGERSFVVMERSHGVQLYDVVGYDGVDAGFVAKMDRTNCGDACTDEEASIPLDSRWERVVSASVTGSPDTCATDERGAAGFVLPGQGGGCAECVATGVGQGGDQAGVGFRIGEGGGLPDLLNDSVAHHNTGHGFLFWQNDVDPGQPYNGLVAYSNGGHGIHWGDAGNALALTDYLAVDNAESSLGLRAVPMGEHVRIEGATVDDVEVFRGSAVADEPTVMVDLQFTGNRSIGVTQDDEACPEGAGEVADDPTCPRTWLRLVDPVFAEGMQPFLFGDIANRHTVWEIRGFADDAYPDLPADFDLHPRDSQVAGGTLHEEFDAWLVPR